MACTKSSHLFLVLWLIITLHLWFSAAVEPDDEVGVGADQLNSVRGMRDGGAKALFVFGDSYADTGNHNTKDPALATPWRSPYGSTWPQQPSGRFSDGRVFTDFFASFLYVRKPLPYRLFNLTMKSSPIRRRAHPRHKRGVNFAYGGSGVFPTFGPDYPDISAQIDQLRDLMQRGLVSKKLLKASMALLVIAGNDYTVYNQQHPDYQGLTEFIPKVVEEMGVSLQVLHDMGFRRITVTNLEPVGCLPDITFLNNYMACNPIVNEWGVIHNSLLTSSIFSLQARHRKSHFAILDLHSAVEMVIADARLSLRPCCDGMGEGRSCGDVEQVSGRALYSLCSSPNETLFWDRSHPTNAGWKAISKALFYS